MFNGVGVASIAKAMAVLIFLAPEDPDDVDGEAGTSEALQLSNWEFSVTHYVVPYGTSMSLGHLTHLLPARLHAFMYVYVRRAARGDPDRGSPRHPIIRTDLGLCASRFA